MSRAPGARIIAEWSLAGCVATSILAAGGWRLEVLPVVAVGAWVAFVAFLWSSTTDHRGVLVPPVVLGLFGLALLTFAQVVPLPSGLLSWVSPKVEEVRTFVLGHGSGALSYESAATLREAGKLVTYGLVAWVACGLAHRRLGRGRLFRPIVLAGLVSAGIAVLHRVLGIERLFGLIETATPTAAMLTTFTNPNHAAGFMVLCASVAVGLADAERFDRAARTGWRLAAAVCAAVAVGLLSKGGLAGLAVAGAVYWGSRTLLLSDGGAGGGPQGLGGAWRKQVAVLVVIPLSAVGLVWGLLRGPWWAPGDPWGLQVKLDGMKDVWPLVLDHPGFGIGRGAFVSVYPQYKTSPVQLTYAFPENLVAQFVAEWGILVGLVAFGGLLWAVVARLRTSDPACLGAIAGVSAIVVQNFVDFSLELAGMAVPVAVIIGATASRRGRRVDVSSLGTRWLLTAMAAVGLGGGFGLAFWIGDLDLDIKRLSREVRAESRTLSADDIDSVWRRHPANPLVSVMVAYARETSVPPDDDGALRAAQLTVYLAPSYADGHLLLGRLLIRRGYRDDGLSSLRTAWSMARGRADVIAHIISLCRDDGDVWKTLPRADPVFDRPDGRALALAAKILGKQDRDAHAVALLERPYDDAAASARELDALAVARRRHGLLEATLRAVRRRRAQDPDDVALRLTEGRILLRLRRVTEAKALLAEDAAQLPIAGLALWFDVCLATQDFEAAESALALTHKRQGGTFDENLVLMAVRLRQARQRPQDALEVLNDALARRPASTALRLVRARLLVAQGHLRRARTDVRLILRRQPKHAEARAMAKRLGLEDEAADPGRP